MQTVPLLRQAPRFDMCKTELQLTRHPGVVIPDTMVEFTRWGHHADSMGARDSGVTLQIALDPGIRLKHW